MLIVLRSSWALMLGILLIMVGNGLQGTLLGVRGSLENIDPGWMGMVMSAYFIGFLGGSKLAPMLLRPVGHVRVLLPLAHWCRRRLSSMRSILIPCSGGSCA